MKLNALHMRFAAIGTGVLIFIIMLATGTFSPAKMVIQLDFGMYPEEFEGLDVEIDGKVVGKLESVGQATRSGFYVKKGRHTVRVVHPELGCEPLSVAMEQPGQKARIMLDIEDRYNERGGSRPMIVLMM